MKTDFLIVGQGLAGSVLARTLAQKGCRVVVADCLRDNTASKVAAGLINPVAGKRVSLSWKATELVPAAHAFYAALEEHLRTRFYYPLPLVRLFSSAEDQNNWMGRSADPEVGRFLAPADAEFLLPQVQHPFGAMQVKGAGYVELRLMLDAFRQQLQQQGRLLEGDFAYHELQVTPTGIGYRGLLAGAVIFCEGYRVQNNPWFSWLPIVPTKGEVLDLGTNGVSLPCMYNKAVYMVPQPNERVRVGATYDWRHPNEEITEAGCQELSAKAAGILQMPLPVLRQQAGIRPAVRDRKPLLGRHPLHPQLVTFNGLGSKGVMMAPFFAAQLADMLLHGTNVYREVDVSRYYSLFPISN